MMLWLREGIFYAAFGKEIQAASPHAYWLVCAVIAVQPLDSDFPLVSREGVNTSKSNFKQYRADHSLSSGLRRT